jgi:hypothetical protein
VEALAQVSALVKSSLLSSRSLTGDERDYVNRVLAVAAEERGDDTMRDEIERMRASKSHAGGLGKSLTRAGFHYKSQPSVVLSAYEALAKAPVMPADEVLSPIDRPGVTPRGRDARWLWPQMVRVNAGDNTSVSDFRQVARAVSGDRERAITAVTEKARLSVTVQHVVEPLKQVAVVLDEIPNAILASDPLFEQFFNAEGRFAIGQALDAHVVARITAASPPAGNTGTGLVERTRHAITAMRAEGTAPSVLVVSPADAAALDLTTDASGGYVFDVATAGSSSPLWGLQVREHPQGVGKVINQGSDLRRCHRGDDVVGCPMCLCRWQRDRRDALTWQGAERSPCRQGATRAAQGPDPRLCLPSPQVRPHVTDFADPLSKDHGPSTSPGHSTNSGSRPAPFTRNREEPGSLRHRARAGSSRR